MSTKSLLLIGSGPGLGSHIARHFASQGFTHIALLSRNATRLTTADAPFVRATPGAPSTLTVRTYPCDLTDTAALERALAQVSADLDNGFPEVVVFNAARVEPSALLDTPAARVQADFQTAALALYTVARWVMPGLVALAASDAAAAGAKPSLLVTSGGLHAYPLPPFFSLGVAKAAQINLLECLALVYGRLGVHVAAVDVGGIVRSPEEDEVVNPVNVAREVWRVYETERKEWEAGSKEGKVVERSVGDIRVLERFRGLRTLG